MENNKRGKTNSNFFLKIYLTETPIGPRQLPITEYLQKTGLDRFVRLVTLKTRKGLIGARTAGARNATAPVLVFLVSML